MDFGTKILWVESSFYAIYPHDGSFKEYIRIKARFFMLLWMLLALASKREESTDRSSTIYQTSFSRSFLSVLFIPRVECNSTHLGQMYGISKK